MSAMLSWGRTLRTLLLSSVLLVLLVACGGTSTVAPVATTAPNAPTQARAVASVAPSSTVSPVGSTRPANAGTPTLAAGGPTPTRGGATGSPVSSPGRGATPRVTAYPLTVKDDAGRTVTLTKRPQRIISLAPSDTEILFALGLDDRVVGVDQFSNYPAAAQAKPKIGGYSATNLEQVVAKEPDLILAAGITSMEIVAALESRGSVIVVLDPADLSGVIENISLVGQLADVNANAATLRGSLEGRIAVVGERLRGVSAKPRVFLELDPTQFFTVGPNSFLDDLIARAGGTNIAADTGTPYPKLNPEQIITKDPEVILLGDGSQGVTPEAVKSRAGWGGISAVKSGRIVVIDEDVYLRPSPRSVDALEQLVRLVHPELFR